MASPRTTLLTLSMAAAFGGFVATACREALDHQAQAAPATAATLPAVGALPTAVGSTPMPSLAPMLARVTPTVVSVHSKQRVRVSPFNDPMFSQMFPGLTQERISESLGSGVIVDAARGLILTNHHVIQGADQVSVTLADGRTLPAEFLGSDPDTDIAVMRVKADKLQAISFANSDQLRVGDFVVAVGNPFGIGQTVTSGIVSAVGRSGLPGMGYQNFIQTDASINPGNSGGALVNLNGELVGINTASFNPRGAIAGNIGLGFAIPANLAHDIAEQLISNKGVVRRGTFGIESQDLTDAIARGLGISADGGAVVTRVFPGSAAARAGLRPGDVITSANGQRITGRDALRNFEGLQSLGSRVGLQVLRDGKPVQLQIGLQEQARSVAGGDVDPRLAGATFVELPASLRNAGLSGVLVESVARGSRAAQNGLQAGDVVLASTVGAFDDLAAFRAGFTQRPSELALRVMRGNQQGVLPVR
ncbi:PDZ domain-containing protein [Lysobacter sp. TY2-98]|uniref:trypsin-like peptidase domain-containing protein n=1 Tax=Lysobacter sp. TY2-98 TaxID=2290922 RepID=UPI000E203BEC|nr:trypsin-like peptidase domain-containing protein [Lysobacter sp. TY2-98]AXK73684.1 PDZ domain-containing protein [Lysobacter sp. TY2-98]